MILKILTDRSGTGSTAANSRCRCRTAKQALGSLTSLVRLVLVALVLASACSEWSAGAQTNNPGGKLPTNRYLLIVETSRAMHRRSAGTLKVVKDLVGSSMHGQMRPGDNLGIWTFNESLFTGRFPVEEWEPNSRGALFNKISDFLKSQPYEKQCHLEKMLPSLLRVVKSSEFITVILISEGSGEIHGTPYDQQINQSFKGWAKQQQDAKMPLVTVLRAQHGQFTGCTVTPAPWRVEIPSLPAELQIAKTGPHHPALAPAKPATPPPVVPPLIISGKKPQPVAPVPADLAATQPPRAVRATEPEHISSSKPEIVTNVVSATIGLASTNITGTLPLAPSENLAQRTTEPAATGPLLNSSSQDRMETNSTPGIAPTPLSLTKTVEPKPSSSPAPVEVQTSQRQTRAPSQPAITPEEQGSAIIPQAQIAATGSPTTFFSVTTVTIFGLLGVAAVCALGWFWKRSHPAGHVSFITRSFDREQQ